MATNDRLFSGAPRGITLKPGKLKGKSRERLVKDLFPDEAAEECENARYVAAGVAANKLPLCVALDGEKPCAGTAIRGKDKCKEHDNGKK